MKIQMNGGIHFCTYMELNNNKAIITPVINHSESYLAKISIYICIGKIFNQKSKDGGTKLTVMDK